MTTKRPLNRIVNVAEIPTPTFVVAVALVRGDGAVLMQKRRFSAEHGGLWEFPGGKVESGETPDEAAVRELAEELGIGLDTADLAPIAFTSGRIGQAGEGRSIVILLYVAHMWEGRPTAHEAEDLGWFHARDMHELKMPPLDYPLARQLESRLEKKPL